MMQVHVVILIEYAKCVSTGCKTMAQRSQESVAYCAMRPFHSLWFCPDSQRVLRSVGVTV